MDCQVSLKVVLAGSTTPNVECLRRSGRFLSHADISSASWVHDEARFSSTPRWTLSGWMTIVRGSVMVWSKICQRTSRGMVMGMAGDIECWVGCGLEVLLGVGCCW